MKSKFIQKIINSEGAVVFGSRNPLADCLRSPSPSVNWAFANVGHGLPFGYSAILYGPPKGGKSVLCNAFVGQLHKDDPESVAIYFNTELRGEIQTNIDQLKVWGIDDQRFAVLNRNTPEHIFDFIEHEVASACQGGEKIKLIVIDSLTNIVGRRTMSSMSVLDQQIGDQALTIQTGLQRILPVIRKHKIALLMTAHVRAEIDPILKNRQSVRMAAAWATKHVSEYFVYVEPNLSKDGKSTLLGEDLVDESVKDFLEKSAKTGHKIRFTIKENSIGPAGRVAEFTLDYKKGIINTFEEVFVLAKNLNIIKKVNNMTYEYNDKKWRGMSAVLMAIRDDEGLYNQLLKEIYATDSTIKL